MGDRLSNLSDAIPAIQPYVGIGPLVIPHSVEFAEAADTEDGYTAMLQAAVALAWTASMRRPTPRSGAMC